MTNMERKIRLNVAIEITEHVLSDLCHEFKSPFSRETLCELTDIIRQLRVFSSALPDGSSSPHEEEV